MGSVDLALGAAPAKAEPNRPAVQAMERSTPMVPRTVDLAIAPIEPALLADAGEVSAGSLGTELPFAGRLPMPAISAARRPSELRPSSTHPVNIPGEFSVNTPAVPDYAAAYVLDANLSTPLIPMCGRVAHAASTPIGPRHPILRRNFVVPANFGSLEVALPVARMDPERYCPEPDLAGLLALPAKPGTPAAPPSGPSLAGLIPIYPNACDPKLPGSRLAPVNGSPSPAPPRSLSVFANLMPDDPAGSRNSWEQVAGFWNHAPRDLKLALFAIPVLVGMALHPRLPKVHVAAPAAHATAHVQVDSNFQQVLAKPLDAMQQNLASRAAVALVEDFRGGMDDWQMHSDLSTPWSFDSNGFVRPGSLALYRPSMHLSDYEMQFTGLIDKKALSFVARARDFENFYVIKINMTKPGPLPSLGITRYAVINGKAQHRADAVAAVTAMPGSLYHVELSVHDDTFLLSLQGKVVDSWSEPELPLGGVGFFSARGEESRVRWVQLTHQYDMLGRLCAFLAPYNISN
jgi:hypothetical protein